MLGSPGARATGFAFCLALFCAVAPATALAQEADGGPQVLQLDDMIAAVTYDEEPAQDIAPQHAAKFVDAPPSVARMADWVVSAQDNQGMPFVVVDKASATAVIYSPQGDALGATAALIGSAIGDDPTPGVGDRELRDVLPEDRTTHAGRFVGGYGPAADGRQVLWIDFETALSMHAVVTTNPKERRLERLASATIEDNRITFGCINVPTDFYETLVQPTFEGRNGVFYILPERKQLAEVFPQFAVAMMASAPQEPASEEQDLDALAADLKAMRERDSAG
jgi:hypothetical protein